MINIILALFISLAHANELTIDVLDLGDNQTQIVVTDLCNEKHILVMDNKELKTGKASKWFKFLYDSQAINQCIKKEFDSL